MAVFRILEAKARPGAVDRVTELLVQQQRDIVAAAPGAVFAQSLRSGDQVLAVSSWTSEEDMQRYLDQEVTRNFYRALPELLMGTPSIRTYEVVDGGQAGSGWADAGPAGDGVDHDRVDRDRVDRDRVDHDGADADGAAR